METGFAPEGITECDLSGCQLEHVLLRAALSETTAEKEEGQPPQPTRSYVLYIGNLNPHYSQEVICSMLKDILGMASITLQRHNIEVIRKRKEAYAFVQVATEVSLELILKQLLLASESEQDLVKELVKKGKNLVVGHGDKFAFGGNNSREVRSGGPKGLLGILCMSILNEHSCNIPFHISKEGESSPCTTLYRHSHTHHKNSFQGQT